MKKLLFFFVIFIQLNTCYAESTEIDVVYLKNGSIIKGKIIEQIIGESVKIETADGSIFVYKVEEIEKIVKEQKATKPESKTRTTPVLGYKDPNTAFMLSFLPPIIIPIQGLGQFYVGKTGDGVLYLVLGLVNAALMYQGLQKEVTYGYDDYGNYYQEEKYVDKKNATIGALCYIGGWLISSFEAKSDATKNNNSLKITSSMNGTPILKICYGF